MEQLEDYGMLIEAGMFDADHPDILLVGSLPIGQLSIPKHIGLAGNSLYWYDYPLDDYARDKANDSGALNAFIRIKTSDDVLRFARRYGPLNLCSHGRPPMHRGENQERSWCAPCGWESIDKWLAYVGLARSCLDFAATLKVAPEKVQAKGVRKLFVIDIINEWLGDAGISLKLNWSSKEAALILTGGGVFGALGVQLLSAITSNTLAVCSGCRMPYLREGRKPQTGRRNYCPSCGDRVANKLRQRDKRERDRTKAILQREV